jgi:hypothetical protein
MVCKRGETYLLANLDNIWKNISLLEIYELLEHSFHGTENWALWKVSQKCLESLEM